MNPERWRLIQSIFERLDGLPAAEAESLLTELCAGDDALRREVRRMLDAAEESTHAALQPLPDLSQPAPATEQPGDVIDRYRLLRRVGEGGFGSVWEAEQTEPVARRVAVKLIKPGMDSREVLARFRAERQMLASLDHPNIARVYDAGQAGTGRPYVVMEFIEGRPIDEACDTLRLPIEARLDLFFQVLSAVEHAHQKGIVHRDLKPSNILVTTGDAPTARVIDFGIAKALAADGAPGLDLSYATGQGQYLGTPAYMSPEQADGDLRAVDTRTDVFGLGAVLYRLLSGSAPIDDKTVRSSSFAELRRIIAEREPARPSARIAQHDDAGAAVAARRSADPARLAKRLRGDLDWVTLKCLAKEPARRYPTVAALADDLRAHLAHRPLLAGPPSAAYRLRKFVRRNRLGVTATALGILALAGTAVGTSIGLVEAQTQRTAAEQAASDARAAQAAEAQARADAEAGRERLQRITEFQARMLTRLEPPAIGRSLVDLLRKDLSASLDRDGAPEAARAEAAAHLDAVLQRINPTNAAIGMLGELLTQARNEITEQFPADPFIAASLEHEVARSAFSLGLNEDAKTVASRALATREATLGPDHPLTSETKALLAAILNAQGRFDEALVIRQQLFDWARRVRGEASKDAAIAEYNLATTMLDSGKAAEAEPFFRHAHDTGAAHPDLAERERLDLIHGLGLVLEARGQYRDAEPYYRAFMDGCRAFYGDKHAKTTTAVNNMGYLLYRLGDAEASIPYFTEAYETRRELMGDAHAETLTSANNLSAILSTLGRAEEAMRVQTQVIESATRSLGPDHQTTLSARVNLATMLVQLDRMPEAEAVARDVLERRQRILGSNNPNTLIAASLLGNVLVSQRKHDEATPIRQGIYESAAKIYGDDNPRTADAMCEYAFVLIRAGRADEGVAMYQRGIDIYRASLSPTHERVHRATAEMCDALSLERRTDVALPIIEKALAEAQAATDTTDLALLALQRSMFTALRVAGRFADAHAMAAPMIQAYEATYGPRKRQVRLVLDAVAQMYAQWEAAEPGAPPADAVDMVRAKRAAFDAPAPP